MSDRVQPRLPGLNIISTDLVPKLSRLLERKHEVSVRAGVFSFLSIGTSLPGFLQDAYVLFAFPEHLLGCIEKLMICSWQHGSFYHQESYLGENYDSG
jgi:hypothetical protein